ncbi:GNAT family N-acetyltransferase [Mycolicibacterium rufum]|uniref:GNAT family N-acetyltransferase n=1 Tax=Mycolicibacterium rufum TaxID=318424 RepID=A0A9X2YD54_9MYCO|nr:GNAT family N-acetyltransferase [Mycolicibacterium rufum]KGI70223.1 GNAT family acetyltransferase [Mycolicibacterium rufum]MCV7071130.1 GNAT family N-acetyltransferase [Mycolicibacterium rufum]ULP36506.1 GNAT family N-acetyltransferase [Mycolicibacterium rufum]
MTPAPVEFDTSVDRVDREWIWQELVDHAYWAKYRTREMFDRQLDTAWRLVGAYDASQGRMLGFARAFSDGVTMAYLADVYVHRGERGRGIASGILRVMIEEGPGRDFRWMLHTNDAHPLYATFGFTAPDATFMQRDFRLPTVRS